MKILFSSYLFHPSVGGIESVSKILSEKFAAAGNKVHVITETSGDSLVGANYSLTRCPSLAELIKLLRWGDLFFQNNISLRSLIPAVLLRKPTLVVHQTWLQNMRGELTWNNRLKQIFRRSATNVAISKSVAEDLSGHSFVIGNPYDDAVFRLLPTVTRDKTLIFVGRLVSDKGVDLLLRALKLLQDDNLFPDLTIVGGGPEERVLRRLTTELALHQQVAFVGQILGTDLAKVLNGHRIQVVPSSWAEPFGVVALEGIACGCVLLGSEKGGLKEAIGPCGLTFENGNARALASRLKRLLTELDLDSKLRQGAADHLAKFQPQPIAAAYLRLMRKLIA